MTSRAETFGRLKFGPELHSSEARWLRSRLAELLDDSAHPPILFRTFFALAADLGRLPNDLTPRDGPPYTVLFDLQRLIAFHDSGRVGKPGICSLVRYLLDGYPSQPVKDFAAAERSNAFRFAYDPAALELLPLCLEGLAPDQYTIVDLLDGPVITSALNRHPEASGTPRIVPVSRLNSDSPLSGVTTGRSLRSGPPPNLGDLVELGAGVIRAEYLTSDVASLPVAMAAVTQRRSATRELCFGKALYSLEAQAVARCEAAERFQVAYLPAHVELVRGSYVDLRDHAVDPRELFFGRSPQCPDDALPPYDPAVEISWTWAWGAAEHEWNLVPAQEVWYNIPELMSEPRFVRATTSGCAVGSSFDEAAVFAALEAIERDAFLTSWYLRRPAREIDLESFEAEELRLLLGRFRLAFPDYQPVLFDLTSDVGIPTIGGLAIRSRGTGPGLFASVATHIEPEKACFRALKDLTGFHPKRSPLGTADTRQRTRSRQAFAGPADHYELYSQGESVSRLDYLQLGFGPKMDVRDIGRQSPVPSGSRLHLGLLLEALALRLRSVGATLHIKDITHPWLAERGLRAARAVTPGLYPLWFGDRTRRFAVTDRLRHLAKVYGCASLREKALQLEPHPLT